MQPLLGRTFLMRRKREYWYPHAPPTFPILYHTLLHLALSIHHLSFSTITSSHSPSPLIHHHFLSHLSFSTIFFSPRESGYLKRPHLPHQFPRPDTYPTVCHMPARPHHMTHLLGAVQGTLVQQCNPSLPLPLHPSLIPPSLSLFIPP